VAPGPSGEPRPRQPPAQPEATAPPGELCSAKAQQRARLGGGDERVGHDAPVVDTTGCGDAFCAGVIVARLAGWSMDDAAALGCATGALNMRALGSDAGAGSVDEALDFMRDIPHHGGPSVPGDPTLGSLRERAQAS